MFRWKSFLAPLNTSEKKQMDFPSSSDSSESSLDRLEEVLAKLPLERAQFLASVALALGQVAYADMEVSEKEKKQMLYILEEEMKLSSEQAQLVVNIIIERVLFNNLDSYRVWETLNRLASLEEKKKLLRCLFELAAEDDISEIENNEISLISRALKIPSKDFVEIRNAYNSKRSILKNLK